MHFFTHMLQACHPLHQKKHTQSATKPAEKSNRFSVLAFKLFEALLLEGILVILDFPPLAPQTTRAR